MRDNMDMPLYDQCNICGERFDLGSTHLCPPRNPSPPSQEPAPPFCPACERPQSGLSHSCGISAFPPLKVEGRGDASEAQLAAYRAMVAHLADIVENCDQAGGALTVTVVREARELLSTPSPATDRWVAERDAKVLREVAQVLDSEPKSNEGASWNDHAIYVLRERATALESRAGTRGEEK